MSDTSHLLHAAIELTEALNNAADDNLSTELAGIVKTHAAIAVGAAFVPVPGADIAAAATNIWTMYVRINKGINLPFAENILKSFAAGVVTNLAGAAVGLLVVGSALKFIPGLGSIGGSAVMATTIYSITVASGIVYMKAVTALLNSKNTDDFTEADLKSAADEVMRDKNVIRDILKEGKDEYKNRNDSDDSK